MAMDTTRKRPLSSHLERDTLKRRAMDTDVLDLSKKAAVPATAEPTGNAPIDLSRKEDVPPKDSDVICLSDDDEEELARLESQGVDITERRRFLRKIATDLRNEEARLLLLRKLKASQAPLTQSGGAAAHRMDRAGTTTSSAGSLIRSAAQQSSNASRPSVSVQQQASSRLSQPRSQTSSHVPPVPAHGSSSSASGQMASRGSTPSGQNSTSVSSTPSASQSTPSAVRVTRLMAIQVLDQRRQSRKTLLRKETEKSLLEVVSPCPSQTELSFIPSIATNEFVALVGMEEVVKSIQENDRILRGGKIKDITYTITPFTCVQCGTDFTPLWKRDRSGGSNVICETCLSTSQRELVQKDYMDKIKAILKKASAQEKSIDKDYKDVVNNPSELARFQREQERHLQSQQPARPASAASLANRSASGASLASHHGSPVSGRSPSSASNLQQQSGMRHVQNSSRPASSSNLHQSSSKSSSSASLSGSRTTTTSSASRSSTAASNSTGANSAANQAARNAAVVAAQAQAFMGLGNNLNLFQGSNSMTSATDFHRQQLLQQALLQQIALLQAQPQAYLQGMSGSANYLAMLQNWTAAANSSTQGSGGAGQTGSKSSKK